MFGKSQPGSPGQVADESSCRFLLSPATDHIVAKVGNALTRRLQTTGIDVLSLDNLTAAKRYHLEHPGHVIAAVDLSFDGLCFDNRSDSSECLVKYQALINSTRLLEVRAGLYPQVEEEVGFLSVQQLMYDSILDVLPQFVSSTILPPNAGRVGLLTKPFPSASSGLSLASAKAKISLITSLYFVAAWIPSVQILLVNIVREKQLRLKAVMRCMGLRDLVFWLAWFLSELAAFCLAIALVMVLGAFTGLFEECDPSLIYLLFALFAASVITFSFLLSTFFENPKVAGAVGSGLIASFSLLFTLLRLLDLPPSTFWTFSLLSPVAMSSIGADIWRGGVRWDTLGAGTHPVGAVAAVIALDTLLYLAAALYLERATAGERLDLLFFVPRCLAVLGVAGPAGRRAGGGWWGGRDAGDGIPLLDLVGGGGGGGDADGGDALLELAVDPGLPAGGGGGGAGAGATAAPVKLRSLRKVSGRWGGGCGRRESPLEGHLFCHRL
jgi:hypothetical protein